MKVLGIFIIQLNEETLRLLSNRKNGVARDASNPPGFEYTHIQERFKPKELEDMELAKPFAFTKRCCTIKIKARPSTDPHAFDTFLFDTENDPGQDHPIGDPEIKIMIVDHLLSLMRENDAFLEQYE